MFCKYCGTQVPESGNFCPVCGKSLLKKAFDAVTDHSAAEAAPGVKQPPVHGPAFPSQPAVKIEKPPRKSFFKNKKALVLTSVGLVIILLVAIIVPTVLHAAKQKKYNEATELMEGGNYAAAKTAFTDLKAYEDAPEMADYCQKAEDYQQANRYLDNGDFEKAKAAFLMLENFKDAQAQVIYCNNAIAYEEAASLLSQGNYVGAAEAFQSLGDFRDAAEQANAATYSQAEALLQAGDYTAAKDLYCGLPADSFPEAADKYEFCINKEDYAVAEQYYAEGAYYDAYLAFEALGSFDDASQRMSDCVQPFPSTGELYHNQDYKSKATSLTIKPPKDGSRNYIKIYTDTGVLVSCIAIDRGEKCKVSLPQGNYCIKTAYGFGNWFGEIDMFGDDGFYSVLKNGTGDNELFYLKKKYTYTLTLRTDQNTSGDTVNSEKENRKDF